MSKEDLVNEGKWVLQRFFNTLPFLHDLLCKERRNITISLIGKYDETLIKVREIIMDIVACLREPKRRFVMYIPIRFAIIRKKGWIKHVIYAYTLVDFRKAGRYMYVYSAITLLFKCMAYVNDKVFRTIVLRELARMAGYNEEYTELLENYFVSKYPSLFADYEEQINEAALIIGTKGIKYDEENQEVINSLEKKINEAIEKGIIVGEEIPPIIRLKLKRIK